MTLGSLMLGGAAPGLGLPIHLETSALASEEPAGAAKAGAPRVGSTSVNLGLAAVWPWESYVTSLSTSHLVCKVEMGVKSLGD